MYLSVDEEIVIEINYNILCSHEERDFILRKCTKMMYKNVHHCAIWNKPCIDSQFVESFPHRYKLKSLRMGDRMRGVRIEEGDEEEEENKEGQWEVYVMSVLNPWTRLQ